MKRHHTGMTLIEVLIATLIMVVLGAGLFTLIRSGYDSQTEVLGQNTANADARMAVDELADHIRGAQINGPNDGPLVMAEAQEIRFYDWYDLYDSTQPHSLVVVRYWVSGSDLLQQVNGLPNAGKVVIYDLQTSGATFAFTYMTYNGTSWVSSSSSSTPYNVGAVKFMVPVLMSGRNRQISGSVRIRTKIYP
jgi:type II secretory pathway pseudopilin PulG